MSQEQSIDDLLRLLKESVASEEEAKKASKRGKRNKNGSTEESSEDAYAIDPEFFNDVELEAEEVEETSDPDEELAPWEEAEEEELPVEEEEELPVEEEEELPVEEEEDLPVEEEEELPVEEEEELPVEEEEALPVEEEEELPIEEEEELLVEEEEELPIEEEEELPIEEEEELPIEEEEELPVEEEEELPIEEEEELPTEEEEELPIEEEEELLVEEEEELPVEEEEALPVEEEEELPVEEEEELPVEEEGEVISIEELDPESDTYLSDLCDYFTADEEGDYSVESLQAELEQEILADEEQAFVPPEEILESIPLESLNLSEEETDDVDELIEEDEAVEEDWAEEEETEPELSEALLGLMKQLGCESEIPDLSHSPKEEEETPRERIDLKEQYQTRKKKEKGYLIRLAGMAAITLILLILDAIPFGESELTGLLNFVDFPGAFLLVGLQILVFGVVLLWRPLWQGVKNIIKGNPDLYSALCLMLVFVAVYDLTLAFYTIEGIVPQRFHFICSLCMLFVYATDYMMHHRKLHLLEVMSAEETRYTLISSDGDQSLAEKMYRGGMNRAQRVYLPATVSPDVRFDVDAEEPSVHTRFLAGAMIPISLLVIATAVVGMAFEQGIVEAWTSAMTVLFATLPLTAVCASMIPLWASAAWMRKRGSALGDISSMEDFSECNVVVFRDLHLFRLCRMEDTGIVFYDKANAPSVMAALEILYSHVGGPMREIFGRVPEAYRAKTVRIRRIGIGGVEAFVDKKSVLLVGTYDFMKQYGLYFPQSEDPSDRATLYVSLNGKQSAKVNARYEIDPLFEMLVNRLASEGIQCVVETYDPLIHSEFVASMRRADSAPISVVHKNAVDLYYSQAKEETAVEDASLVSTMSRLKLAEALVWCRRVTKILRRSEMMSFVFSGIGLLGTALLFAFGSLSSLHEYWLVLYGLLPPAFMLILTQLIFPKRFYFTEKVYFDELTARDERRARAAQKKQEAEAKKKEQAAKPKKTFKKK